WIRCPDPAPRPRPFSSRRYTARSFPTEARDQCASDAAVFALDGPTLPAPARRGEPGIHGGRMTSHSLTIDRVSYRLADGRPLFSDLSFSFEPVATGLVGANGAGKSVLARLLAGQLSPDDGRVHRSDQVFLLPTPGYPPRGTVGELAGVGAE